MSSGAFSLYFYGTAMLQLYLFARYRAFLFLLISVLRSSLAAITFSSTILSAADAAYDSMLIDFKSLNRCVQSPSPLL